MKPLNELIDKKSYKRLFLKAINDGSAEFGLPRHVAEWEKNATAATPRIHDEHDSESYSAMVVVEASEETSTNDRTSSSHSSATESSEETSTNDSSFAPDSSGTDSFEAERDFPAPEIASISDSDEDDDDDELGM